MPLMGIMLLWQHWESGEPVCDSALLCLVERLVLHKRSVCSGAVQFHPTVE